MLYHVVLCYTSDRLNSMGLSTWRKVIVTYSYNMFLRHVSSSSARALSFGSGGICWNWAQPDS